MANHSSAKKAARQTEKKTARNKDRLSEIKTFIKRVKAAIIGNDKQAAVVALSDAHSKIMKGINKNILKLNKASRTISRLSKKIKSIQN
jgi:small subunit ribosomal protein S20